MHSFMQRVRERNFIHTTDVYWTRLVEIKGNAKIFGDSKAYDNKMIGPYFCIHFGFLSTHFYNYN